MLFLTLIFLARDFEKHLFWNYFYIFHHVCLFCVNFEKFDWGNKHVKPTRYENRNTPYTVPATKLNFFLRLVAGTKYILKFFWAFFEL